MNSQTSGLKANIQDFENRLYKVNDVLKYNKERKVNESITLSENTISSNNDKFTINLENLKTKEKKTINTTTGSEVIKLPDPNPSFYTFTNLKTYKPKDNWKVYNNSAYPIESGKYLLQFGNFFSGITYIPLAKECYTNSTGGKKSIKKPVKKTTTKKPTTKKPVKKITTKKPITKKPVKKTTTKKPTKKPTTKKTVKKTTAKK